MIAKFSHGLIAPALLVLSTLNPRPSTVFAQGTAFTYQGRLQSNGSPASGSYNLNFAVFTDSNGVNQVGGTLTTAATQVTNGLFTVELDFGPGIFTGAPLWLQIGAETNGVSSLTTLAPLQQLTPTPYAIYAPSAGSAASANGVAAGAVTGAGIAGNSVVKSLNSLQDAVTLAPGANVTITPSGNTLTIASSGGASGGGSNSWSLTGNSGTVAGINFLGTTDNQPLELHVNGTVAFRLVPGYVGDPNVVGGSGHGVGLYSDAVTIAGGSANSISGQNATIGGGYQNSAANDFSTIAGGSFNSAENALATVGGGEDNQASGDSATVGGGAQNNCSGADATIGGGLANTNGGSIAFIGGGNLNIANGEYATIGGGQENNIGDGGTSSTIGGGYINIVNGSAATVGGGQQNNISSSGYWATIPGGIYNTAAGVASFAAGHSASANDNGSFVWGDGSRTAVSQGANTFTVLATGGAYFYTTASGVDVVVDNNGDLDFGTTTRQMINLYSSSYGIGVQANDEYFRSADQFFWYLGGTHNDGNGNSGGGTQLMELDSGGNLTTEGAVIANGVLLTSDRNAKENFAFVDSRVVLAKVASLPVTEWNYKSDSRTVQHIGPMAQDFQAAFQLGADDKHISVVDESGVALAAIQGLNQKLNEKDAEIQELKQRVEALEKLVLRQEQN
ncbi:MAG: tail fiber domain-containing protein [Verrucomicrobiota bacterium]